MSILARGLLFREADTARMRFRASLVRRVSSRIVMKKYRSLDPVSKAQTRMRAGLFRGVDYPRVQMVLTGLLHEQISVAGSEAKG